MIHFDLMMQCNYLFYLYHLNVCCLNFHMIAAMMMMMMIDVHLLFLLSLMSIHYIGDVLILHSSSRNKINTKYNLRHTHTHTNTH